MTKSNKLKLISFLIGSLCSLSAFSQTNYNSANYNSDSTSIPSMLNSAGSAASIDTIKSQIDSKGKTQTNSTTTKPFGKPVMNCTAPWGEVVAEGSSVLAYQVSNGTYNTATGVWAGECAWEMRLCDNSQLSGTFQYQDCVLSVVNGSCGAANGTLYPWAAAPNTADLCNPNYLFASQTDTTPTVPAYSSVSITGSPSYGYSWTCNGQQGLPTAPTTASCFAPIKRDGECGASYNTCNFGTPGSASATDIWGYDAFSGSYWFIGWWYSWSCAGVNGGATAACSTW